jgi:hypothetical protein
MTYKLQPWQQQMIIDIESGGLKPGEMAIMMAGRGTGKSQVAAFARLFDDIMKAPQKVHDIVLSEGTIYGSRYYTAEPIGGNWLEMEDWCRETFGPGSRALWGEKVAPYPAQRWYANNRKFWFKREKDRDWFIIRWRS